MMRTTRYIGYFLAILSCAPTLVSMVLSVHSFWIKHEMLERLENEQLHSIVLKQEDVQWHEKGSELNIEGQLFDVKDFKEENGSIICWGIFDKEETALANWVENHNEKNEEDLFLSKVLVHLLTMPLIDKESSVQSHNAQTKDSFFGEIQCILPIEPTVLGTTPPPDRFLI